MTTTLTPSALTPALLAALSLLQPTPPGGDRVTLKPEPIKLTALRIITEARDALRPADLPPEAQLNAAPAPPFADRTTITLSEKGRTPVSAVFTLRIAPGKARDQHDATVSIDAGDLRIHAANGELTAVLASNTTTFYRATYGGPPDSAMLKELLHPFPSPTLALFFAKDGEPLPKPVPQINDAVWSGASILPDSTDPVTLNGTADGRPGATLTFDWPRKRLRAVTLPLSGEDRSLTITLTPTDAGEPATWAIDTTKRRRVDALHLLPTKPAPEPAPLPETSPAPTPSETPKPAQ